MATKREAELEAEVARLEPQVEVLKELVNGRVEHKAINPASFTAKQHVVLQGLHEGMTNEEIAERMDASLATVKGHMHSIMNHLGVRRRDQVIDLTQEMMDMDRQRYAKLAGVERNWITKQKHAKDDPILQKKTPAE